MKKLFSIVLSGLLMIELCLYPAYAGGAEEPEGIYAMSACLLDGDSGRILWGRQEEEELPMASTTKIMTCILALENGNTDDIVTASENAAGQPKVHLGVRKGQQFTLEDLLFALMLESYNDAAVMIAEHIGGSVEGFADLMNAKAREIGCTNTHFVTPNGLDDEDEEGIHHTTAADLALIMRYCVKKSPKSDEFCKITQTMSHSFSDVDNTQSYSCTNHNALLTMIDGVVSGKTGFTSKAGYCYVCAVENEGRLFIISLLACGWPNNKGYKWADTRKILEYAENTYTYRNILGDPAAEQIQVENAVYPWGESAESVLTEAAEQRNGEESFPVLLKDDEKITRKVELTSLLTAPVHAGDTVGTVTYLLDDRVLTSYPMICTEDVRQITLQWMMNELLKILLLRTPD